MRKILIADDHVAVREGLLRILNHEFPGAQCRLAEDPAQIVSSVTGEAFDLLILDLSLPGRGGLDVIKQVKDVSPSTAILIYTVHPDDEFGLRALRAGADGYVTKDRPVEDLLQAIGKVSDGKRYISEALTQRLANLVLNPNAVSPHESLSDRELQILQMLGSGLTPSVIASRLNLSIKTVSTYRTRLLGKLDLQTTGELIRYAIENKITN
ncbi:MAG: response regulator transcription factor [Bryobacterales bacterium]|nr:response regulator transcription factor [Bryobacterales bacterium]